MVGREKQTAKKTDFYT